MTTIAVRAGVMASDSRATYESEAGGSRVGPCTKLYRRRGAVIGTAGEVGPALAFLDWYGKTPARAPEFLRKAEGDFQAIVLRPDGVILLYEGSCFAEPFPGEFWAIGSGAKAALGAMHMGATAAQAVQVAAKIDPYTDDRIVTMRPRAARTRP